ncbi:MAG: glycosyltransferase family 2 protein [Gammaproteobacteria bacterium]|jgi:GT2 family glycosyltransferase|nr:glycosyltransferase family 2 protein [Gammaproteobacteria bacterium]MBT3868454.1 glycosyltransferase family 2 protein [Gammaproteobacteria bacterium]MBT4379772.1 glycosyltransferase family 2 protein [Gammaproteobacteria bacterium]MBT4616868.1 glycosyltransferase family 2 protein [Gammaproteobacteria bacterium]MBT5196375.1 glycosyltransferase family 2 protein [Gammaproteobacteria bacterium]
MSVAVIIVNYNSGALLDRCLQSLLAQTFCADELVVVDNASTDAESQSILDAITTATVIKSETNLGYGGAINLAVRKIDSPDYIVCLNPDAFPEPDWLEALVNAADSHPDYGSFASLMLREDDTSVVDGAGDELHFTGIPWRRFHQRKLHDNLQTEPVFSACAGAALYRTVLFNQLGGFDDGYFMYVEDIDLGFRLQLAGYPCLFVRDAIVHHIGSAVTGEGSDFSVYFGHRNLVYCYFKNMPLLLLLTTLPFHVLANLVTLIVLAVKGRGGAIGKAKLDALKKLPSAIRARNNVSRKVSSRDIWKLLNKSLMR